MTLKSLESELKKRLTSPYQWGRRQCDDWDRQTKFIYGIKDFESLENHCRCFDDSLKNYAYNRWLNFWSARAVEYIFSRNDLVRREENPYSKTVDFYIGDTAFDHKSTVFPKKLGKSFEYAKAHKQELIEWLYENQSSEGRQHFANRIFIIFYDGRNGEHWKLKAQLSLIKTEIYEYLANFSTENLVNLQFNKQQILSDLIWVTNE